jgi:hypothetical protein
VIRSIGEIVSAEQLIAVGDSRTPTLIAAYSLERKAKLKVVEASGLSIHSALSPAELVDVDAITTRPTRYETRSPVLSSLARATLEGVALTALFGATLSLVIAAFLKY